MSAPEPVHSDLLGAHRSPIPHAVRSGPFVFCSAVAGFDMASGEWPAEPEEEARNVFRNLAAVLQAAGLTLGHVVRIGVFMRDLHRDRPVLDVVWRDVFGSGSPSRFAVEVADFGPPGTSARFLIEAMAHDG